MGNFGVRGPYGPYWDLAAIPFGWPIADLGLRWSDKFIKIQFFPRKSTFYHTIGPQNAYIPLDIMLIYIFTLDAQETSVQKTKKRPTKSVVLRS